MSEEIKYITVSDLNERSRYINLKVKSISRNEEKTVKSRKDGSEHRVCNILVGDDTGVINLVLWDNQIDQVELDKSYEITNSYITLFRDSMQVSLGRYGSIKEIDEEITPNMDNNLSERQAGKRKFYRSKRYSNFGKKSY
ncbi:MAG: hypothetical protein GF329_10145 [Candidatus Lokiarchaeota archaeon]|nr:hypothetical protein [Candidatus Lokiarchaeota archaeon]